MRNKYLWVVLSVAVATVAVVAVVFAGNPDSPPGPPESTYSYTLEHIYQRLDTGAAGTPITFTEPISGPETGTMHTLDDIMGVAPAVDDTNGATQAQVLVGRTSWGLTGEAWGVMTGTMPDNGAVSYTPSAITQTIAMGYHDGSGHVVGDTDLVSGNIRSGMSLFGVSGDPNVVDTSSGDAVAGEILTGKKAWVDGVEVIGTYPLAPVPKTGQTISYTVGDDGDLEKGVAWPSPRFITSTTGIVTDTLTGLVWLQNANCMSFFSGDSTGQNSRTWSNALTAANSLANGYCGLIDGSSAGDWRLPNVRELQSLVDYGHYVPALPSDHPFTGVQSDYYWSSTTLAYNTSNAWRVYLYDGVVYANVKTFTYYVWPVRGGQ